MNSINRSDGKENKIIKYDQEYDEKIARLLQSTSEYNTRLQIIIGAGNTGTDLARHRYRYNIALGGETSREGDQMGLFAFPFHVPSEEFEQMIDVLGKEINQITIDISVCAYINIRDIIRWIPLLHPDIVMYIPYRNLITSLLVHLDDIVQRNDILNINKVKKQFNRAGIMVEFFDTNLDLKYPIEKRGISGQDGNDIVTSIGYIKLSSTMPLI